MALRRLIHQSGKGKNVLRAGSSDNSFTGTASIRFMSTSITPLTENEKAFQAKGFLDDRGLTVFDTLHEMQVRSCEVFAPRKLFGTYSKESKQFEWMTYQEFDREVNKCRAVLKDIGTSWEYTVRNYISS
jgi:long-chain acyl-CoA synthetase